MRFLKSKERKEFFQRLNAEYGYEGPTDFVVYEGGKDKFFIISRDLERIPFEDLYIRQGGLHVASDSHGDLRLTMDGAQLLGPHCTKQRAQLSVEERDAWMKGQDVPYGGELSGFVVVAWQEDILGCGRIVGDRVTNFVPKERRIADPHA